VSVERPIWELTPADFEQHSFHIGPRAFGETNCYVDLWIGLLHALDLPVEACMGFGLASDFEGDQWTFVKPAHGDLDRLYGIGVEELSIWRSLPDHVAEQVARHRIPLLEADSFFLPDTHATDYRRSHVKSTIGITYIDQQRRQLRYFHNAGFFELAGEDFAGLFRLDRATPDDYLPPYCEVVKLDYLTRRSQPELRALARSLGAHHFAKRPRRNPVTAYAEQMQVHMGWVVAGDDASFHRYSFSSLRQLGSALETLSTYLRWLDPAGAGRCALAAGEFDAAAAVAKRVILKLARVSNSKRVADLSASFTEMADHWDRGMKTVEPEFTG